MPATAQLFDAMRAGDAAQVCALVDGDQTPLALAEEAGQTELAELLRRHGGQV